MVDLLIVAACAAFIVSFVERWVNGGLLRGGIALAASIFGTLVTDHTGMRAVVFAMAAAFTALIMVLVGERLATPPPLVVDNRRR